MKYLQSEGVYLPIGRKKHLRSLNSQTHCLSSCFVLCSGITRLNDSSTPTSFRRNSDEMCGLHVAVKALNGMLLWQGTCWISSRRMLEGPRSAWYAECHCPAYKNKGWWRECSWFIFFYPCMCSEPCCHLWFLSCQILEEKWEHALQQENFRILVQSCSIRSCHFVWVMEECLVQPKSKTCK